MNVILPLILAIAVTISIGTVSAEVVSLTTNSKEYNGDDSISFSGSSDSGSGLVSIVIRDPDREFVTLINANADTQGSFQSNNLLVGDLFDSTGAYLAIAFEEDRGEEEGISITLEWDGDLLFSRSGGTSVEGNSKQAAEIVCKDDEIILNGKCVDSSEVKREELKISLATESGSYHTGDVIRISGVVSRIDPNHDLSIKVTNPAGDIVMLSQLRPDSNGKFSTQTLASGPVWEVGGTYKILAGYDNKKATATFEFENPKSHQPQAEKKPKLPVAPFVDERKDPRNYIERYREEPQYKDWFERIYSEYPSIYEAVGLPGWLDTVYDWYDGKAISEQELSNAIKFLKEN